MHKVNKMIDEGIATGNIVETSDITYTDLKQFKDVDVLYRHFKDKKCYDEMCPVSSEPVQFFASAKIQKFKSLA